MRIVKIAVPVLLALVVIAFLAGPIGPVPGVFIGGTSAESPEAWPDTSKLDEIRLKVPGTIPRVVIIWVIEFGGELHVVGSKESGWVQRIGTGSPVEMRMEDRTYALRATPVSENWREILEAYTAKYEPDYPDIVASFPTLEEAEGTVAVLRLDRI
ncbi:MAG: hypothetical protein QNK05_16535 [Myxococcota bacterium]|nr:hypothetical protein [Myxococcota bacterium]